MSNIESERLEVPLPEIFLELRRDSKSAVVASGKLSPLAEELYVRDSVDERLEEWVRGPSGPKLMILTGSAGHGKSAAIATARRAADDAGVALEIRFDATHSDSPTETYRDGLRRFLEPFRDDAPPPEARYLLAMNLGLALNFFTGSHEDLRTWSRLAKSLDNEFKLGLDVEAEPRDDVEIIDLSKRMVLDLEDGSPTTPFLEKLVFQLTTARGEGPVHRAVERECRMCPRQNACPVFVNVQLLSDDTVRANLVHALTAAAVKEGVHLTPRNVLDFVSRIVLPPRFVEFLDTHPGPCDLKELDEETFGISDSDQAGKLWGQRLEELLMALAFPRDFDAHAKDSQIFRGISTEDPAAIRTMDWDFRVIGWSADPNSLFETLPAVVADYLETKRLGHIGRYGMASLLRVQRWLKEHPKERSDTQRFNDFIRLCLADEGARRDWEENLPQVLESILSRRFHDHAYSGGGRMIAVPIEGAAGSQRILAPLSNLRVDIRASPTGKSANHAMFFADVTPHGSTSKSTLAIDWRTFDLISDVADGYAPSAAGGAHETIMSSITRRLLVSAAMQDEIHVELPDSLLRLRVRGARGGRTTVEVTKG